MSASLASIQEWLTTSAQSPVAIWCDDPETHKEKIAGGLGGKTFLSYRVSYKQGGRDVIEVRHRYSEFETMRTDLKDRYHPYGILVPALPPKNQITSMTNTFVSGSRMIDMPFVKERTFGLTMFCESIVAIPWLKHDATWRSFLLPSSQLSFGSIYGQPEATTRVDNVGEQQLLSLLSQLALPYEYSMMQKMDELREEINLIEKHSKFLLDKVRALQSAQRALFTAQEQMKTAFVGWSDVERLHLKSLAGKAFNEYENVLKPHEQTMASFGAVGALLQSREDCESHSGDYIGLTMIAILEQQMSVVEAYRELFQWHDSIWNQVDGLQTKINKLESGTAIISFMSSNTSEQLSEAKRQFTEKKAQLNLFYKGLVYFTVPLMSRIRAGSLRRLNAIYASCCMSESFNAYRGCVDFFRTIGLSAEKVAEVAAKICDGVSLQPVARLSPAVYAGIGMPDGSDGFIPEHDTCVYETMGFLSKETEGMTGLFERALTISKSKGGAGMPSTGTSGIAPTSNSSAPPQKTHFFTSTITADTSLSTPQPANTSPLASPNPLLNKRSSAIRNKQNSTDERDAEKDDGLNVDDPMRSRESESEMYDKFDENKELSHVDPDDDDFALPYRESAFNFQSAYGLADNKTIDVDVDASSLKKPEVFGGEKAASLLDSLLGGPPPPRATASPAKPAAPPAAPVAAPVAAPAPPAAQPAVQASSSLFDAEPVSTSKTSSSLFDAEPVSTSKNSSSLFDDAPAAPATKPAPSSSIFDDEPTAAPEPSVEEDGSVGI